MTPSAKTCKFHPNINARRTCYYCKEPICPQCQHHYEKHIFCSRRCYWRWKAEILLARIKQQPQTIMQTTLVAVSVLLLIFYFNFRLARLEERIEKRQPVKDKTTLSDTTAQEFSPFMVDSVRRPVANLMELRFRVQPGAVLVLERDNRMTATFICRDSFLTIAGQRLYSGENRFALWMLSPGGKSTLIDSFAIRFNSSRIDYLRRYVSRVDGIKKELALTFDGGSLNIGTEKILDILKETGVHCTIFLTGAFIRKYPGLVLRMVEDGHEIGNHSYNHPHLTKLEIDGSNVTLDGVNREFVYNQLHKTDSLFYALTHRSMAPYWRAPYGELNNNILLWAAEAGYKHIGWSQRCDTWDWVADTGSVLYRSNGQILEHVLKLEEKSGLDGKILLMHLGTERKADYPYMILEEMIKTLQERGYRFARISELLKKKAGVLNRPVSALKYYPKEVLTH